MAREPEAVTAMRGTLSGSALFSSAANEGFRYLGDMSDVLLYIDDLTATIARLTGELQQRDDDLTTAYLVGVAKGRDAARHASLQTADDPWHTDQVPLRPLAATARQARAMMEAVPTAGSHTQQDTR